MTGRWCNNSVVGPGTFETLRSPITPLLYRRLPAPVRCSVSPTYANRLEPWRYQHCDRSAPHESTRYYTETLSTHKSDTCLYCACGCYQLPESLQVSVDTYRTTLSDLYWHITPAGWRFNQRGSERRWIKCVISFLLMRENIYNHPIASGCAIFLNS